MTDNPTDSYLILDISGSQGYAPDQIEDTMTLGDLLEVLVNALDQLPDDTPVVLRDASNRYGAKYGAIDLNQVTMFNEEDS